MKQCRKCLVVKPASDFTADRANRDGLGSYCRPCEAARHRAWRKANPERAKALDAAYREAHPWVPKPKKTPEIGSPAWRLRRAYAQRVSAARFHARKFDVSVNDLRLRDWLEILDQHGHRCYYCGSEDDIQIEHVVPLSTGGPNTRSNVVPACRDCNWRKRLKPVDRFLANQCARGHDMDAENTYVYPNGRKTACKACRRDAQRRCDARRRQKAS